VHKSRLSYLSSPCSLVTMPAFMSTRVTKDRDPNCPGMAVPHVDLEVEYRFDVSDYTSLPLVFSSVQIRAATDACWNLTNTETTYQPQYIDMSTWNSTLATGSGELALTDADVAAMAEFSELCRAGAVLMRRHQLRQRVGVIEDAAVTDDKGCSIAAITVKLLQGFVSNLAADRAESATEMARKLNDFYIGIGWLEKYFLFQEYDESGACRDVVIPKHTLARPYMLLARIFGNHEEFTYYNHYVGSSCSNMQAMREWMLNQVDFSDPESIKRWVLRFDALYDFQLPYHDDSKYFKTEEDVQNGTPDPNNMPVPMSEFLISERYFRFIHLAMEMIWSDKVGRIHTLFRQAIELSAQPMHDQAAVGNMVELALGTLLEVEKHMNLTFKTLPLGSEPAHYNHYVRPWIAGTWGRNCGTVFEKAGKFFEGIGNEPHELNGTTFVGKWKKHVGQTGAGTSVRPIGDEFAGGVSDVYTQPLPGYFCLALMRDQQAKVDAICQEAIVPPDERDEAKVRDEIQRSAAEAGEEPSPDELESRLKRPPVSALALMLTLFRAVTRPYSHNYQIQLGSELISRVQNLIDADHPALKLQQLKLQLACLLHRLDHYFYVHMYINEFKPRGSQLRTAATGGTNTTDFLPDLIDSNMDQARQLVAYFKDATSNTSGIVPGSMGYETVQQIERTLDNFSVGKAKVQQKAYAIQSKEDFALKESLVSPVFWSKL